MLEDCMSGETVVQLHVHASRGHPIKLRGCQDNLQCNVRVSATETKEKTSVSVKKDVNLTIIRGCSFTTVAGEDPDQVYNETDFFIYSTSTRVLSSLVFKIDVYHNSETGIVGHGYISSSQMTRSSGNVIVVLVNDTLQYVGTITVEYLLTHPWHHPLNVPTGQQTRRVRGISGAEQNGLTYLCGHRGTGQSFDTPRPSICPENTISAFKAANKKGIDFIEMDVQVSKDKVPIVFHDTTVKLSSQADQLHIASSSTDDSSTCLEVPVKDLTLEQMQSIKVFGITESIAYQNSVLNARSAGSTSGISQDLQDYKLFPTLKKVFNEVPEETGLLLELKYPLEELGGENIDYQCVDENEFVDSILQVVFDNARDRKVFLASFDANICSMCQMKQSVFPVLFITQDDNTVWAPYTDLRTRTIDIAIAIAKAQNLDGIHTFSDQLFKSPERIERVLSADLILSVWGASNDDPEKRRWLQAHGVHCIQVDNIFDIN